MAAADTSSHLQQQQPSSQPDQQQPEQQQQQQQEKQPFWFYEDEMPCPPDILELGRSTWTLLHSMAAYYPDTPTPQQQQSMNAFISALGDFYPCQECAGHLRKELSKHPPDVSSAAGLSGWACRLHNLVNLRLGKPEFDCAKAFERWRDGPADDDEACPAGH
ncbi:ERV/ALR sulfhydryl oxidase domain-containing protein [Scenedesmus sp. NREL 46B-D3]|nr:ERV/ALR sulfhydryl oxidase domain-containing protein [Scenedesmus sp. NREL 46B-D3]